MKKDKFLAFIIIVIFLGISTFLLITHKYQKDGLNKIFNISRVNSVTLGGVKLHVELAITEEEQAKGLSARKDLKDDAGMLFIFPKVGKYYFWMKDMNFPIDMIWINEGMKVIYIKKDAKPEDYLETFGPDGDTKYVLETVAGFSDQNNLQLGDSVEFGY